MTSSSTVKGAWRFLVVLNPIAGKGKALKLAPKIEEFLKAGGAGYEILFTKSAGHGIELVQNLPLDKDTAVVAAGGDGTCNEVVNGLLRRKRDFPEPPLMGILPIGRGNDFTSSTRIPTDVEGALRTLVAGEYRTIDAGKVTGGYYPQGRYFINGVGIGFDTMVGLEAAKLHVQSGLAYALGAIKMAVTFPPSPILEVHWTEQSPETGEAVEKSQTLPAIIASIMNGRRMGGSFFMGPDARLDDGALDLCMAEHRSRSQVVKIILHYTKGTQHLCGGVTKARSLRYTFKALEGGMVAHSDGETICLDGKDLEVECVPGCLRLIGA
ncbi:MAG: diacylglycerol kinase family lipid kinase [Spirochaetaceae bacterium]|jgi:YegS/Rv2252/BmrU family lipid kinase|nr:diacylglycerol kinase family lipid kinase [Spirochaetaceae bacterium]